MMRYKKDTSAQVESAELVVIKGKASSSIGRILRVMSMETFCPEQRRMISRCTGYH
ncbi:hypothetical protein [Eubacterium ramulus]|uniref:hypothetical protein n=1 Tax=Eubacterium ramulus TaxID=39490 RepID=UPI00300EC50D